MMRAVVLNDDKSVNVVEVDDPQPADVALVKTQAAGVCGTELHILDGMLEPPAYPFVLGHEGAGVVSYVPDGTTDIAVGDRVAIYNFIGCGRCHWCRTGREEVCRNLRGQIGFNTDGTFRDVVPVPVDNLIKLPDNVPFEDAAILSCSGMTAVHALRLSGVALGDSVVVDGVGGVGLMVIQAARAAGARVIAIADTETKGELARQAGADESIILDDKGDDVVADKIRDHTGGAGSDHFFELVGTTASMLAGIHGLDRHGSAVIIGYTGQELHINPIELVLSEVSVRGSVAAAKQDLETAIALAGQGQLSAQIDTRYPMDDVNVALDRLRRREVNGRNVLVW